MQCSCCSGLRVPGIAMANVGQDAAVSGTGRCRWDVDVDVDGRWAMMSHKRYRSKVGGFQYSVNNSLPLDIHITSYERK